MRGGIVALAGSRRLDDMMRRVLAELRLAFQLMGDPRRFYEPYVERNAEIVTLLERGRTEVAAETLRHYLDDAERHLLAGIAERESPATRIRPAGLGEGAPPPASR